MAGGLWAMRNTRLEPRLNEIETMIDLNGMNETAYDLEG